MSMFFATKNTVDGRHARFVTLERTFLLAEDTLTTAVNAPLAVKNADVVTVNATVALRTELTASETAFLAQLTTAPFNDEPSGAPPRRLSRCSFDALWSGSIARSPS